jgi:hypothetical protein
MPRSDGLYLGPGTAIDPSRVLLIDSRAGSPGPIKRESRSYDSRCSRANPKSSSPRDESQAERGEALSREICEVLFALRPSVLALGIGAPVLLRSERSGWREAGCVARD